MRRGDRARRDVPRVRPRGAQLGRRAAPRPAPDRGGRGGGRGSGDRARPAGGAGRLRGARALPRRRVRRVDRRRALQRVRQARGVFRVSTERPLRVTARILDLVGGTPMVQIRNLPGAGAAEVWAKCEHWNPGGSVKDRIAKAMLEAAEATGTIAPGRTTI